MAIVREPADLAKLVEAERAAWPAVWSDVEALLRREQGDQAGRPGIPASGELPSEVFAR